MTFIHGYLLAGLVLVGLPILSFLQFLGGIDPNLLLAGFAATIVTMVVIAGRGDRDDRVIVAVVDGTSVPTDGCRHGPRQRRTQSCWLLSYRRPRCGVAMPDTGREHRVGPVVATLYAVI